MDQWLSLMMANDKFPWEIWSRITWALHSGERKNWRCPGHAQWTSPGFNRWRCQRISIQTTQYVDHRTPRQQLLFQCICWHERLQKGNKRGRHPIILCLSLRKRRLHQGSNYCCRTTTYQGEALSLNNFNHDIGQFTKHARTYLRKIMAAGASITNQHYILIFSSLKETNDEEFKSIIMQLYEGWRTGKGDGANISIMQLLAWADSEFKHLTVLGQWKTKAKSSEL